MFFNKKDESFIGLEKEIKKHVDEKFEKAPSFEKIMSECKTSNKKEVLNKELVLSNGETVAENRKTKLLKMCVPVLIIAILASVLIGILVNRENSPAIDPIDKKGGYFIIDVNPSLELSYDKDGNIKEATPLNEDAEIVLYNLNLVGVNYKVAIDLIVDKLVELKYIAKENVNAILTTAVSEDGIKDESMTSEVKTVFETSLTDRQIKGEVLTGVVNEELQNEAEQYGIDAQKLDLIKKLKEIGVEIPENEYSKVSIRELYHKISQREKEIATEMKEKLKEENDKKKQNVDKQVKDSVDFIISIIGDDFEQKAKIEDITEKYEKGECTAEDVISVIDEIELGGFEIFIDMILMFKNDLQTVTEEFNKSKEEWDKFNMSLEEKYNQRIENANGNNGKTNSENVGNVENNGTDRNENSINGENFFDFIYGDSDADKEKEPNKETEKEPETENGHYGHKNDKPKNDKEKSDDESINDKSDIKPDGELNEETLFDIFG